MPLDPEAFADMVLHTVETAMGPVLQRLAAAEALLAAVGDVRDRVVTLEAKHAIPPAPDPILAQYSDRILTLETKHAAPSPLEAHLSALKDRIVALEARPLAQASVSPEDVGTLRDRLTVIETKTAIPSTAEVLLADVKAAVETLREQCGDLRDRVAVVETRQPVPGPPGKDGQDGTNGKDGADGISHDEIVAVQIGDREIALKGVRGDRTKELGTVTIPVAIYRGVYEEGKTYDPGDLVTWGGNVWHCKKQTTLRPEQQPPVNGNGERRGPAAKDFWQLAVKAGRDGKDGKDGRDGALPVVKVQ